MACPSRSRTVEWGEIFGEILKESDPTPIDRDEVARLLREEQHSCRVLPSRVRDEPS